jgi:Spy/CpxP family protein refolding chaperone
MNSIPQRKILITLVASLALNLFFGGMFFSNWLRYSDQKPSEMVKGGRLPRMLMVGRDALDPEGQKKIDPILQHHMEKLTGRKRSLGANFDEITKVLILDPTNKQAVDMAFSKGKKQFFQFHTFMRQMFVDIATTLTPEQRKVFFSNLPKPGQFRKGRRFRGQRAPAPF